MSELPNFAPFASRVELSWEDDAPGRLWQQRNGTLVFVDISGFTALSERLGRQGRIGAEELTAHLDRCFGELLADAYVAGGALLKFGGDALLFLFDGQNHPQRAVSSAIRMRRTLREVGRITTSVGSVRLRMSVGVHAGVVHLFRVGGSHRELVITGPCATGAVAMEATAGAGEILVSATTVAHLDPRLLGAEKGGGVLLRERMGEADFIDNPGPVPAAPRDLSDAIPVALRDCLSTARIEGEHRNATVAFLRFEGIEELLVSEGGDAVACALDRLVRTVQDAADREGVTFLGTDVDRDGGKIILVAGVPSTQGNDNARVLRAVHDISGRAGLPVRIGVNRGGVFAGVVGVPYRRTYTVMGDAVNLAARLMAKAEVGQILATESATVGAGTFALTAIEPFEAKGKSEFVEAVAVGPPAARSQHPVDDDLRVVGRTSEIAAMRPVAADTADGHGGMIQITGPAGIGKSRLVRTLVQDDSPLASARAVTALCDPFEAQTPYFAARLLVRALLGRDWASQWAIRIGNEAPSLLPWLPLIADVIGTAAEPTRATEALDRDFRRPQTVRVLADLLSVLSPGPTVFIVDDAHWIDQPSADLLRYLARYAHDHPWLVCVVARDTPGWLTEAGACLHIALEPLDDSAADSLVASDTPDLLLSPHLRRRIVEHAGGNPLFLRELVRSPHAFADAGTMPASLTDLVAAELDRLAPADRSLLRHIAVLGPTFELALVDAVTDAPGTADAALPRLGRFVEPLGPGHGKFRNHCFWQGAYDALSFRRRRELHGRAADAIAATIRPDAPEQASVLSFHTLHAGRYEDCWDFSRTAADHAWNKYANVEAVDLLERALVAARHLTLTDNELAETWTRLAQAALDAAMFERAARACSRARRLWRNEPSKLAELCAKQAHVERVSGRPAMARRWLRRGMAHLHNRHSAQDDAVRTSLLLKLGQIQQMGGRLHDATRSYQQVVDLARARGFIHLLVRALVALDHCQMGLGSTADAPHAREALELLDREDHLVHAKAEVLTHAGAIAFYKGRWDEATEMWQRAFESATRAGDVLLGAYATSNIAEVLIRQGRWDEIGGGLVEAAQMFRSYGDAIGLAGSLAALGLVQVCRGEITEALTSFRDAAEIDNSQRGAADAGTAECWLRLSQPAEALVVLNGAINRASRSHDTASLAALHRLRGYAYLATDQVESARSEFDSSLAAARAQDASYEIALSIEARAVLAHYDGRSPDHTEAAERACILTDLAVIATPPPPLLPAAPT